MNDRSVLFVHAHPDDECIPTGVTIAKYAAEGAYVTVVTCTLGEVGEIVADDLAHLDADALGDHRMNEMAEAAKVLGITDHRWLGGAGRWRDSGMMGTPENDDPRCFWQADLDEAVGLLAEIVREVKPQVVVTYDENGGYGHPDHIQAHRVAMGAVAAAAPDWQVEKVYYTEFPKSVLREGFEYMKASGNDFFAQFESADDVPFGTPDELVTTTVRASEYLDQKYAAMRAHRSQIKPDDVFFALPPEMAARGMGWEYFQLKSGTLGELGEDGREDDLFAGLGHAE